MMSTTTLRPAEHEAVETPPQLDAASNGMSMTPEEFDAVEDYDPEYRYELIRGVVVVNPIPNESHEAPGDELGYLLRRYRWERPEGVIVDETLPNRYVRTSAGRRLADRVIWAGLGRRPNPRKDPPTIAVEFVSRSARDRRRDYVEKRQEYREAGVKEYWIVDWFQRQMTVAFADGTERVVRETETYSTPLLPGFDLPLSLLLARADAWADQE
jgi:Uma2 family endonuclease